MSDKKHLAGKAVNTGVSIFFSRITGFLRDQVLSYFWGTGIAMAAFTLAFKIPNLLRNLFGEGALSAAFIPFFTKEEKNNPSNSERFAGNIVGFIGVFLSIISTIGIFLSLVGLYFAETEMAILTLKLLPWFMPYIVYICITAILSGILNTQGFFLIPNLMPCIFNLVSIFCAFFVCPFFGTTPEQSILGMIVAVLGGGLIQVIFLYKLLKRNGFNLKVSFKPIYETIQVLKLSFPALISSGLQLMNSLVDSLLAYLLGAVAVSSLFYSQRIIYLPIGIFAVAIGMVCLPLMSRKAAEKDLSGIKEMLNFSLRFVLFLTIPTTIFLFVFANELITVIFQRGAFTQESTIATVFAFLPYCFGIPFFAAAKIITPVFYSQLDTKTPVRVSIFCLIINLILNLVLMQHWQQAGLAAATSISSIINIIILLIIIRSRFGEIQFPKIVKSTLIFICASLFAILPNYFLLQFLLQKNLNLIPSFFIISFFSGIFYLIIAYFIRCEEITILIRKVVKK